MTTIIRPDTCRMCKYCVDQREPPPGVKGAVAVGVCHGGPPQVVALAIPMPDGKVEVSVQSVFPEVHLDWHCKQWTPKITVAH